jgi:sulfur-carrier protein adenylyltransferase/sulfurtransferase
LNSVLKELGKCDIIVDATANPMVFNALAAVAKTYSKPLVWCEVYAGGIGGSIARSRPEIDPDPQTMRSKFNSYSTKLPKITTGQTLDYSSILPDGAVLIATDAEVSLIAAHATRLALDTLLNANHSIFPVSTYLIGFSKGWVFEGPFDTIPLDVGLYEALKPVVSDQVTHENSKFIESLLPRYANATAAAA